MEIILLLKALILGVVEGLTEFLPVSSTGHLILVGDLLNFNDERGKAFEVIIQFGAILAVCWEFREKLLKVACSFKTSPVARRFVLNLLIAAAPAMGLGYLFSKHIKAVLFAPIPVATAFIVGALVIFCTSFFCKWFFDEDNSFSFSEDTQSISLITNRSDLSLRILRAFATVCKKFYFVWIFHFFGLLLLFSKNF